MANTATALVQGIQNARMAYVQSDEISILLNDWDRHETEQWFDGTIQKMASISASIATAAFNFGMMQHMEFGNVSQMAQFDARVFNVPMDEVTNYFIWRQQDASRNSVQMLGHFYFSQKELHCKSNPQTQDMLMLQKGINWNDLDVWKKRGSCAYPTHFDTNIPIFTQDREYIERLLRAKDAD
jgi:tRNA(His) 5'-end guanylyltransferase